MSQFSQFNPLAVAQSALNTPLAQLLAARIQSEGPITFRDWMDACLYHPQHGYYRRGRPTVGRDGDFLTSPEVHPLFGASIAHVAVSLWEQLDRPAPFRVAEIGPGTGALAEAFLRHVKEQASGLAASLEYTLVEPNQQSARMLPQRLDVIQRIQVMQEFEGGVEAGSGYHMVVANELLDALPVHRLRFQSGDWRELWVGFSAESQFTEAPLQLSDMRLIEPLEDTRPVEGQIVEVSPERAEMTQRLATGLIPGGLLLLFDYGYRRERLYASWRRSGTLMTFSRHVPGDDPYLRPGEIDLTAHIDIDQVETAARETGLTILPSLSQAEWLHHLGADVFPGVAEASADPGSYLSARRAIEQLTDPAGLGRISVLGYRRDDLRPLAGWVMS